MDVNEDGDLALKIGGHPSAAKCLYQIRVGIVGTLPDDAGGGRKYLDVVDYSAILGGSEITMIVHGAWIRNAIDELRPGEDTDSFDIVISEGHALDPNNGFQQIGKLRGPVLGGSMGELSRGERRRLKSRPSKEERGVISLDMLQGRKPQTEISGDVRRRTQNRGKADGNLLLVHDYCATNQFPPSHFSGALVFSDPESGTNNWSHDTFARKLFHFADGLSTCGIIGHSQGGMAALHLLTWYWSCLDNSKGPNDTLIQTVGTPWQGTPLATPSIASLGKLFGFGCGFNPDLTYDGASSWLEKISPRVRDRVTYYTTSFTSKWWRNDYCDQVSGLFLRDPDDGITEIIKGQLPNGHNGGHQTGWCHKPGMRDPDQCKDHGRNIFMNTVAAR